MKADKAAELAQELRQKIKRMERLADALEAYVAHVAIQEHIDKRSQIVASWPAWKRGILEASSKPCRDTPRPPVL